MPALRRMRRKNCTLQRASAATGFVSGPSGRRPAADLKAIEIPFQYTSTHARSDLISKSFGAAATARSNVFAAVA